MTAAQTVHMYARRRIQFPRMCIIHCHPQYGTVAAPPPRQSVSLSFLVSRTTDVMAMKDALGGWSGGGPMHCTHNARRHLRTHWVAVPQCQPTNADSRRGHIQTTLTTGPAGLHHPATWASLPDTGAWTIARNCPIAQVRYTLYNGAAPSVSC